MFKIKKIFKSINNKYGWYGYALFFTLLTGSIIRFLFAYILPFFGDECGTMLNLCYSTKDILTHFNGWLTMHWFIVIEKCIAKLFGESFFTMRFISFVTGTAIIVVTAIIYARIYPSPYYGLIVAVLVAINPQLIYFSANARVYALLVFWALLLWLMFLKWREKPTWTNSVLLSTACLIVSLLHLTATSLLVWLLVGIIVEIVRTYNDAEMYSRLWSGIKRLSVPLVISIIIIGIFDYQLQSNMKTYTDLYVVKGFTAPSYIPYIFKIYCGAGVNDNWMIPFLCLFFLLIGLIRTLQKNRPVFFLGIFWFIIPVLFASAMGFTFTDKDFARFHIFTLPLILIFIARGIDELLSMVGKSFRMGLIVLLMAGFVCAWSPNIIQDFNKRNRLPYHKVFNYISGQLHPGDNIAALDPFLYFSIQPYMNCSERRILRWSSITSPIIQDSETGRLFLISWVSKDTARFGVRSVVFGDLMISVLPPESQPERLDRIIRNYEDKLKLSPAKLGLTVRSHFFIQLFRELEELRGNNDRAKQYGLLEEEIYRRNYSEKTNRVLFPYNRLFSFLN